VFSSLITPFSIILFRSFLYPYLLSKHSQVTAPRQPFGHGQCPGHYHRSGWLEALGRPAPHRCGARRRNAHFFLYFVSRWQLPPPERLVLLLFFVVVSSDLVSGVVSERGSGAEFLAHVQRREQSSRAADATLRRQFERLQARLLGKFARPFQGKLIERRCTTYTCVYCEGGAHAPKPSPLASSTQNSVSAFMRFIIFFGN